MNKQWQRKSLQSKRRQAKRNKFSYNYCVAVLKQAWAKQASPEAVEELRKTIESMAFEISKRAALFADDEARSRLTVKDVRSAMREFLHSPITLKNLR